MSTQEMIGQLREAGVNPTVLKAVRADLRKTQAPPLTEAVISRLLDEVGEKHKAWLVLGRKGHYSVFSPEGHEALCASTRKNKPWAARAKKTKVKH